MGTLAIWVRKKEPENPDVPLKGPLTDSFSLRHTPWTPAEGPQLRRRRWHTEKDWVAWCLDKGQRDNRLCSFVWFPSGSVYRRVPSCQCWTFPPHGQFWSCIGPMRLTHSMLCLPGSLPHPAYKLLAAALSWEASQPHPALSLGHMFIGRQKPSGHMAWARPIHFGERFLVVSHWCQPKVQ